MDVSTEQTIVYDIHAQNKRIRSDYIEARKTETNLAYSTQRVMIHNLNRFSKCAKKEFKDITRDDIISFLNSLRKSETDDPNHKWIGTYNLYLITISTFFKWFYHPKTEPKQRPKPDVIQNLKQLKRKEKSTYKPSDMWTQEDDLLFLKYCPSKRDRAYHAISRDSSCRPHELLKLKIKDVVFKMAGCSKFNIKELAEWDKKSVKILNSNLPLRHILRRVHLLDRLDVYYFLHHRLHSRYPVVLVYLHQLRDHHYRMARLLQHCLL